MSLLIFFPLLMVSLTTLEWTERAAMPRGEAGGAVAFLDGELVIAGGTTWERGIKVWLTDTQVYQPASNRWVPGRQLPVPLAYGPFISSASGLEIFGGTDGKANHQTSWKLHAANKAWERTGSVPAGVLLGRAAYADGSAFIFGGCGDVVDLTTCSDAVWRRNGSEWHKVSALPGGATALAAIAVSGSSVYLFGGCSAASAGKVVNHAQAYRYDAATNRWASIRELKAGNRGLTAFAFDQRFIYLFGGYTDSGFSADVLQYDIKTDVYSRMNPMPLGLLGIEFVLNGRRIYGAGGEDRMQSRSARLFEAMLPEAGQ